MKKTSRKTDKFTGVLIDRDAWDDPQHLEYACNFCSRLLVRLSSGNTNESWFCRNCQIEYLDKTDIRKKSKLGTQREEIEPDIASVGAVPIVSIRHEPELRGVFAALAKKGTIRFTSYNTTEKE